MRARALALLLLLAGCDDHLFPAASSGSGVVPGTSGWCAVQGLFRGQCTSCHGSGGLGGLDLLTDPYAALVGVESGQFPGVIRVVPGDPAASLLYQKITGTQGAHGGSMPPGGSVDAASADVVQAWIADGAPSDCATAPTGGTGGRYHPEGWADPADHGLAAKLQEQQCTSCHGADLTGDVGPSCDSCHAEGWRTNCTFCHGGVDGDPTGAPPEDIDDNTDPATISFPPHLKHVHETEKHVAWDCTQCHVKPTDVLSPGHIFVGDTTPGRADLTFSGGFSPAAHYGAGTCSDLYCHGDGQGNNGEISADAGPRACDSCHPSIDSGDKKWEAMSGDHDDHLEEGITCAECHGLTTQDNRSIVADPQYHVNGQADLRLPVGMQRVGNECTGSCHGEQHNGRSW